MLKVKIRKKLNAFDLDVEFGVNQTLGFIGASGSGKSMTLKCIAGLEKPDEGYIEIDGKVLFDSNKKIDLSIQERNVGYLFQNYALFDNMTVYENVASPLKARHEKEIETKVTSILKEVQMEEFIKQYPRYLSGGQKQRVALARLLVYKPSLILLDEPFSALDEDLKEELIKIVKRELAILNKPTLFVSHNSNEVEQMCNQKTHIIKGKLV